MFKPSSVAKECKECNGKCWVAGDQLLTQTKARMMFGVTPNPCINGTAGAIRCPKALGIL